MADTTPRQVFGSGSPTESTHEGMGMSTKSTQPVKNSPHWTMSGVVRKLETLRPAKDLSNDVIIDPEQLSEFFLSNFDSQEFGDKFITSVLQNAKGTDFKTVMKDALTSSGIKINDET